MMTIKGRHIKKAIVERRRRKSRRLRRTGERRPTPCSTGDQVWTVLAILRARRSHRIGLPSRFSSRAGPRAGVRWFPRTEKHRSGAQSSLELVLRPFDHVVGFFSLPCVTLATIAVLITWL